MRFDDKVIEQLATQYSLNDVHVTTSDDGTKRISRIGEFCTDKRNGNYPKLNRTFLRPFCKTNGIKGVTDKGADQIFEAIVLAVERMATDPASSTRSEEPHRPPASTDLNIPPPPVRTADQQSESPSDELNQSIEVQLLEEEAVFQSIGEIQLEDDEDIGGGVRAGQQKRQYISIQTPRAGGEYGSNEEGFFEVYSNKEGSEQRYRGSKGARLFSPPPVQHGNGSILGQNTNYVSLDSTSPLTFSSDGNGAARKEGIDIATQIEYEKLLTEKRKVIALFDQNIYKTYQILKDITKKEIEKKGLTAIDLQMKEEALKMHEIYSTEKMKLMRECGMIDEN